MKRICRNCVLHSGVPEVTINERDLCSLCDFYEADKTIAEEMKKVCIRKTDNLFDKMRDNPRPYDVLVLFSGGKDSTCLIKIVKDIYHLNPIAYTVIHPLMNDMAIKNIEKVAQALQVEVVKYYMDEHDFKTIIRYRLLNGHKYGLAEVMGCDVCTFLHTWIPFKFSMKMGIPVILSGSDHSQSEYPFFLDGETIKENVEKGEKIFGRIHDLVNDALENRKSNTIFAYNKEEILKYNIPSIVSLFSFLDYDYKKKMALIQEMGLKDEDFDPLVSNCSIIPFFAFFSLKRYDCVPFIRVYARELRKRENPRILPTSEEWQKKNKKITRETIIRLLDEFESILNFVIDKRLYKNSVAYEHRKQIDLLAPTYVEIVDRKSWEKMVDNLLMVNYYFRYLEMTEH